MKISFVGEFDQRYRELTAENSELKVLVDQKVMWFKKNPNDTRLDNHALTKQMEGKWAFNITDDIRIVYEWLGKNTVRFLAIGSHKEVYKSLNQKLPS